MDRKSFFVNLSSVDSLNYFPYNSSLRFSNLLSSATDLLDNYEVALASIIFEQKNVANKKRMLILADQSRIVINYPSKTTLNKTLGLADWYLGVEHVINTINGELKKIRYAHLEQYTDEEKNQKVVLYVYLPFDGRVILDNNLAALLGLSQTTFENGKYIGVDNINIDILRSPRGPIDYSITLIKFVNIFAVIPKPLDSSLDSLSESINAAFENKEIDIV